ncbi:MAG: serine/threonine-protein kinase [Dokdonella sp.]
MTTNQGADPPSWHSLELQLDDLLDLPPAQRAAALGELADSDPESAERLALWLASIERSEGFLEPVAEPDAPAAGLQVGAWRLLRTIGRGGMGEVWLAARADGAFEKNVAIKFIRADRPGLRERLVQERRLLARLDHPHIARLLDGGIGGSGHPYLVTEFVDGIALDRWCRERRPALDTRLAVFRSIAEAVSYAHANLVVHRDLKSANVLVDDQDQPTLLDFGIAKLIADDAAETAEHALTPDCAAPEQITGGAITTRTDVYALGALLYQLLTGRTPLGNDRPALAELVRRVCEEMPPAPSAISEDTGGVPVRARSRDLDAIVLKALAKVPHDRYATVDALLADLARAALHRPVEARRDSFFYRARRFLRRNRLAVATGGALVVVLLLGAAGTLWQARVALRERDSALYLAERNDAARDFLVRLLSESKADAPLHPREMIERASQLLDQEPQMRADVRAMARSVVGELELERRDYANAEKTFRTVAESAGDAPDELAIDAMCQLGATQIALDKSDDARHWLDLGIAHARSLEGSQRATLATCLSYAGMRSRNPADMQASLALSREAVDVIDHLGGRYASRQSALHNNYANVLASAGQPRAAIVEFRRAIALLTDAGRSRSADRSTAAGNLASALADAGLLHEADDEYTRAIALRRDVSGESVGLAQQMISHASVLVELGRADETLAQLDKAEAILIAHADPPGLRIAQLHLRRAGAYAELGRRSDAEREYDATEKLYAQVLSPQSAAHTNVMLGRAALWMRTGADASDLDRAGAQVDQAFAHDRANAKAGSGPAAKISRSAAELALLRGDAQGAQALATQARARYAVDLDPGAWQIAACDALLGEAAARQGRSADGRNVLATAMSRLETALSADHWRTQQARSWLMQMDSATSSP